MLKISIVEVRNKRRLLVEGMLIAPWSAELERMLRRPGGLGRP